jgi:hypothetical protein
MLLTTQQSYELLAKHGCYAREACDRCGQVLGHVRYTRKGDDGVWCSRECRDGKEAHAPGTCKACGCSLAGMRCGTKHCSDTCRKRENRKSKTAQISRDEQLKTEHLQGGVRVSAIHGRSCIFGAPEGVLHSAKTAWVR